MALENKWHTFRRKETVQSTTYRSFKSFTAAIHFFNEPPLLSSVKRLKRLYEKILAELVLFMGALKQNTELGILTNERKIRCNNKKI